MCENTCFLQSEDILGHFQTVAFKFCFFLCIEGKTDKFRGSQGSVVLLMVTWIIINLKS